MTQYFFMEYNPHTIEMHVNPTPTYHHLLENKPCYFNNELNFYALSRFEDVWCALTNPGIYSSKCGPILELDMPVPIMLSMDSPEHNRNRGLISRHFTPSQVAAMEPEITRIVRHHLDMLADAGSFDIVGDFAAKFPMDVISAMIGIPIEDRAMLRDWSNTSVMRTPGKLDVPPEAMDAMVKMYDYLVKRLDFLKKNPGDDILSRLIHATYIDESGKEISLPDDQLLGFFMLLINAGNETVTRSFGMLMHRLISDPALDQTVIQHPEYIAGAVEEILRIDNPGQYMRRVLTQEVTLHGVTMPAGATVLLLQGAAGRDPREFEDPDTFNIHRKIKRQIGFGFGPHLCLGAALARMESRIGLEEINKRFPKRSIIQESVVYACGCNVRGFEKLCIAV